MIHRTTHNDPRPVTGDPYDELAFAVLAQAGKDYRALLRRRRGGDPSVYRRLAQLERFFDSKWCRLLAGEDIADLPEKIGLLSERCDSAQKRGGAA